MIVGLIATGSGVAVSVRRGDETVEEFTHFQEEIGPTRKVIKAMKLEDGFYSEYLYATNKEIEEAQKAQRVNEIKERIARLQAELNELE